MTEKSKNSFNSLPDEYYCKTITVDNFIKRVRELHVAAVTIDAPNFLHVIGDIIWHPSTSTRSDIATIKYTNGGMTLAQFKELDMYKNASKDEIQDWGEHLFTSIYSALRTLHFNGIVFGDMMDANIMISTTSVWYLKGFDNAVFHNINLNLKNVSRDQDFRNLARIVASFMGIHKFDNETFNKMLAKWQERGIQFLDLQNELSRCFETKTIFAPKEEDKQELMDQIVDAAQDSWNFYDDNFTRLVLKSAIRMWIKYREKSFSVDITVSDWMNLVGALLLGPTYQYTQQLYNNVCIDRTFIWHLCHDLNFNFLPMNCNEFDIQDYKDMENTFIVNYKYIPSSVLKSDLVDCVKNGLKMTEVVRRTVMSSEVARLLFQKIDDYKIFDVFNSEKFRQTCKNKLMEIFLHDYKNLFDGFEQPREWSSKYYQKLFGTELIQ